MWSVAPLLLAVVVALRGPSAGVNGTLHVQTRYALYSLDKKGALLWRFNVPCTYIAGCLRQHAEGVNGTVYLVVDHSPDIDDNNLIALDGSTGVMKWNYSVAGLRTGDVYAGDMEVGVDGTVYLKICSDTICTGRFQTVAVSSDGSLKWSLDSFNPVLDQAATQGVDGTVFLHGLEERWLYAVWPEDGSVKWHQQYLSQISIAAQQTVVAKDGMVFASPLHDLWGTFLMALSGEDGSVLWEVALNLTNPSVEINNGEEFIYVHHVEHADCGVSDRDCKSCRLRAYHHRSGKEAWAKQCDGQGSFRVAKLLQPDETAVESLVMATSTWSDGGQVLALDGRDGSVLWRMVGLGLIAITQAPLIAEDGTVIVTDSWLDVTAIRGGQEAWRFSMPSGSSQGLQDVMTSDGVTYIQRNGYLSDYLEVVAVSSHGVPQWTFSKGPKILV